MFADQDGQEDPSDVCGDVAGLDGAPWDERLVELVQDSPSEGSGEERQGGPPAGPPLAEPGSPDGEEADEKEETSVLDLVEPGDPAGEGDLWELRLRREVELEP